VEPEKQPLLGNGCAETPVTRHAIMEVRLEAVLSVRSLPRVCNVSQLQLWESPETGARRVGV
jgi:hypothetical protein